jgi:hypothetical protein
MDMHRGQISLLVRPLSLGRTLLQPILYAFINFHRILPSAFLFL